MKKMRKRLLILTALSITAVMAFASPVFAASGDNAVGSDGSGNCYAAGQDINLVGSGFENIDNELFAAGMNINAKGVNVDGSAFIAGSNLYVEDAKIGSSLFIAGQNVVIDADIKNNIWAAGNGITVKEGTSVKAIHAAGNVISVDGEYESVYLAGDSITFSGVCSGDVTIEGENVTVSDDAVIDGVLKVIAPEDPKYSDNEKIGEYVFEQAKEEGEDSNSGIEGVAGAAAKAGAGALILAKVGKCFKLLIKYAVLALILAIVFKNNLNESYEMATKKPGAFWGFGALALICGPLIMIILCITVVGLPIAGLSLAFYMLALFVARVFTFASLVRELIFTHTGKRLNPILETVIAVLPAAVIKVIPLIGGLVGFACAIYMMGYVVNAFAKTISENWPKKAVEENTETV